MPSSVAKRPLATEVDDGLVYFQHPMHSKTKDNNNKKPRLTGGVCSAYSEVALAEYSSGSSRRFDAAASHFHRQTRMIENSAAGNFGGNSAPEELSNVEMQTTAWESSVDWNDSTNVIRLSQQRRPVIISPDAAAAAEAAATAAASLAVRSNASRPACPRCLAGEPAHIKHALR